MKEVLMIPLGNGDALFVTARFANRQPEYADITDRQALEKLVELLGPRPDSQRPRFVQPA